MEEKQNTTMSIFDYLFDEGDFEIILHRIFLYLDAASLESCGLVCKRWRKFILRLFQRHVSYSPSGPLNSIVKFKRLKIDLFNDKPLNLFTGYSKAAQTFLVQRSFFKSKDPIRFKIHGNQS